MSGFFPSPPAASPLPFLSSSRHAFLSSSPRAALPSPAAVRSTTSPPPWPPPPSPRSPPRPPPALPLVLLSRPSSSLPFASRRLAATAPLRARGFPGAPIRAAASAPAATAAAAAKTIAVGDRLPDATLSYFDSPDGELKTVTVRDLTAGKKVVHFAVPGAFTPTCTQKHLSGFVAKAGELRAKGVDAVACVSVNDAFVMRAWKESLGVGDEVLLLSDGNGDLARAMGVELDLSDKPVGLGVRSRQYVLLAEDGVVKVLNLEEGGTFTNSSAEDMLKAL